MIQSLLGTEVDYSLSTVYNVDFEIMHRCLVHPSGEVLQKAGKYVKDFPDIKIPSEHFCPVIVMTFWYVLRNGLNFFELFKLLFSLGIDHDPPCSLCSNDLCLSLFSFFTRSYGQEKSLSYYDLLSTSEYY